MELKKKKKVMPVNSHWAVNRLKLICPGDCPYTLICNKTFEFQFWKLFDILVFGNLLGLPNFLNVRNWFKVTEMDHQKYN
jgi:hypothetical protein